MQSVSPSLSMSASTTAPTESYDVANDAGLIMMMMMTGSTRMDDDSHHYDDDDHHHHRDDGFTTERTLLQNVGSSMKTESYCEDGGDFLGTNKRPFPTLSPGSLRLDAVGKERSLPLKKRRFIVVASPSGEDNDEYDGDGAVCCLYNSNSNDNDIRPSVGSSAFSTLLPNNRHQISPLNKTDDEKMAVLALMAASNRQGRTGRDEEGAAQHHSETRMEDVPSFRSDATAATESTVAAPVTPIPSRSFTADPLSSFTSSWSRTGEDENVVGDKSAVSEAALAITFLSTPRPSVRDVAHHMATPLASSTMCITPTQHQHSTISPIPSTLSSSTTSDSTMGQSTSAVCVFLENDPRSLQTTSCVSTAISTTSMTDPVPCVPGNSNNKVTNNDTDDDDDDDDHDDDDDDDSGADPAVDDDHHNDTPTEVIMMASTTNVEAATKLLSSPGTMTRGRQQHGGSSASSSIKSPSCASSTIITPSSSFGTTKRLYHPRLSILLPGGCHGRTSRNNSFCRRQPCFDGSNYCKMHYQQYGTKQWDGGDDTNNNNNNDSNILLKSPTTSTAAAAADASVVTKVSLSTIAPAEVEQPPNTGNTHGRKQNDSSSVSSTPTMVIPSSSTYSEVPVVPPIETKAPSVVMTKNSSLLGSSSSHSSRLILQPPVVPNLIVHNQDKRYTGMNGEVRCQATTTRGRACAYVAIQASSDSTIPYDDSDEGRRGGNDDSKGICSRSKYCNLHADYDTNPPPRRHKSSSPPPPSSEVVSGFSPRTNTSPREVKHLLQYRSALQQRTYSRKGIIDRDDEIDDDTMKKPETLENGGGIVRPGVARTPKSSSARASTSAAAIAAEAAAAAATTTTQSVSLLSMVSTDQWYQKRVIVSTGPLINCSGRVERWGNGWVSVRMEEDEKSKGQSNKTKKNKAIVGNCLRKNGAMIGGTIHNRRSFELILHPDQED